MDTVREFAESARERRFLAGFVGGYITNGGHPFHLGESELALVEESLRMFETGSSFVILNQFPTTAVPLAVCASYAYSQHPATGGDDKPLLLFPSSGYLGRIDDFHYSRTLNPDSSRSIIPRWVVRSPSEVEKRWGIFSAPSNEVGGFNFDTLEANGIGAVFVDFQSPEWSDRMFDRLDEFCEANPNLPAVFYAQERDAAVKLTCERLGVQPLEVTNKLLATAESSDPVEGESDLTVQQRVLSNGGVNVGRVSVTDEGFTEQLDDLIDLRNKLKDRNIAPITVSRIYNALTMQPIKPMYWAKVASKHGGPFDDIASFLDELRERSDRAEGIEGDLLSNYVRKANHMQGYLNDRHALQNTVLDAIQRARDAEIPTTFVVKNTPQKKALERAVEEEGYGIVPHNTEIRELGALEPDPDRRHVFVYPPYRESYVYKFPPSKQVVFVHFAMWDRYVETASEHALDGIPHETSSTSVGGDGGPGEVEDFRFDIEEIEDDIERRLSRNPLSLLDEEPQSDREEEKDSDGKSTSNETLRFHFTNGETADYAEAEHVTIFESGSDNITRKTARGVDVGDRIILVESVTGDIYDILVENAHRRDTMRECLDTVERWRNMLDSVAQERNLTDEDVIDLMKERGSEISDPRTVQAWRKGGRYGPKDGEDIRRTIDICRPGLQPDELDRVYGVVLDSVKTIRIEHRRIGRDVRRAIEAEVNPTTSAQFGDSVNENMIKDIARDIKQVTIEKIIRLDEDM